MPVIEVYAESFHHDIHLQSVQMCYHKAVIICALLCVRLVQAVAVYFNICGFSS